MILPLWSCSCPYAVAGMGPHYAEYRDQSQISVSHYYANYGYKYANHATVPQHNTQLNLAASRPPPGHRRPAGPHPSGQAMGLPLDLSDPDGLCRSMRGAGFLHNTYWVRFGCGRSTCEQAVGKSRLLFDAAAWAGRRQYRPLLHRQRLNRVQAALLPGQGAVGGNPDSPPLTNTPIAPATTAGAGCWWLTLSTRGATPSC